MPALIFRSVLAVSALTQIGFGLAFICVPKPLLEAAGGALDPADPAVLGLTINLGCLVLLVAWLCTWALRCFKDQRELSLQLGASVGVMLLAMGIIQVALLGQWASLAWDGSRGTLLLVSAWRLRD